MTLRKEILAHQKPDSDGRFWFVYVGSSGGTYSLPCTVIERKFLSDDMFNPTEVWAIRYFNPDLEEAVVKDEDPKWIREETEYTPEMMQICLDNAKDWL